MRGPIEDGAGRRGKSLTPSRSEGGAILRKPDPPRPVTKTTRDEDDQGKKPKGDLPHIRKTQQYGPCYTYEEVTDGD